jgi:hypothetical protein
MTPARFTVVAGCVPLLLTLVACSDDEGSTQSTGSTSNGDGIAFDDFVNEYFDETACDGFEGCGDPVEGRYRSKSFKICSSASQFTGYEDVQSQLDGLCSTGVDLSVEMNVDLEIEVTDGNCSGGGEVTAQVRLDVSDQCIRESGGPSLAQACPELSDALADVPEFSEGGCSVRGSTCSCVGDLGVVADGRCEDFVLDSACVKGDTVTFSNAADSSQPAIWTFERVKDGTAKRVAVPVETSPADGVGLQPLAPSQRSALPSGTLASSVVVTERVGEQLKSALPRLAAGLRNSSVR